MQFSIVGRNALVNPIWSSQDLLHQRHTLSFWLPADPEEIPCSIPMARCDLPVGLTCSCLCILFILQLPSGLPAWPTSLLSVGSLPWLRLCGELSSPDPLQAACLSCEMSQLKRHTFCSHSLCPPARASACPEPLAISSVPLYLLPCLLPSPAVISTVQWSLIDFPEGPYFVYSSSV